jgi:hypothetical protein
LAQTLDREPPGFLVIVLTATRVDGAISIDGDAKASFEVLDGQLIAGDVHIQNLDTIRAFAIDARARIRFIDAAPLGVFAPSGYALEIGTEGPAVRRCKTLRCTTRVPFADVAVGAFKLLGAIFVFLAYGCRVAELRLEVAQFSFFYVARRRLRALPLGCLHACAIDASQQLVAEVYTVLIVTAPALHLLGIEHEAARTQ